MAIGKVDAYATVQAPNVDFGDIALNAQKFQGEMLDKLRADKEAKAKAEKPKEFEANYVKSEKTSGIASYESSRIDTLHKANDRIFDIKKTADSIGGFNQLPSQVQVEYQNLQSLGKQLDSDAEASNTTLKTFQDNIANYSKAGDSQINFVSAAASGKLIMEPGPNGKAIYRAYKLKDDNSGEKELDKEGKPFFATFTDKFGNVKDHITNEEIRSGDIINLPKAFDELSFYKKTADFLKLPVTGTDTGSIKKVFNSLSTENESSLKSIIETQVINNRDNLIDTLYKLDPIKYKEPKKEYLEEDKQFARNGLEKGIKGGIALSNVTDKNAPTRINIINGGPQKPLPTIQEKPVWNVITHYAAAPKEGLPKGQKRTPEYIQKSLMLPISRGDKIDVAGVDSNIEAFGKSLDTDGKSIRYFLKYTPTSSTSLSSDIDIKEKEGENKTGKQTIGSKMKMEPQYLYLNGKGSDAAVFMNVASKLINPRTNNYFNNDKEVRDYLDSKINNNKLSKTYTSKQETTAEKMRRAAAGK